MLKTILCQKYIENQIPQAFTKNINSTRYKRKGCDEASTQGFKNLYVQRFRDLRTKLCANVPWISKNICIVEV